jgi:Tfp pilus assembly protein PilN
MIRTNLATRPFYNERAVNLWLFAAALIVAAATALNVLGYLRYTRTDTRLANELRTNDGRAADLRRQAAQLRASVDVKQIEAAAAAAREANELIDRRTFSWTELLNRLETTLPADAHIVAIRPHVDQAHRIVVVLNVVAREVDDVGTFMENLEQTGAFKDPRPTQERVNEEGLFESQLEAFYVPSAAAVAQAGAERP